MENHIKEEWYNGVVMMSPRPAYNHMRIELDLYKALDKYFGEKCNVVTETSLYLTKENVVELKANEIALKKIQKGKKAELVPDIAVYCDENQIFEQGFLGIPQLVIEILSPNNVTDDTETKKIIYSEYCVPEYWIVSPMEKKAFVYRLEGNFYILSGKYNFTEQEIKSARFEDLVVDIKNIKLYEVN